ncbi:hypothetical protein TruAng_005302 [Truncatella angustata]|nr:hypothetical protein TruAng_005302 [Truncatella angustata]
MASELPAESSTLAPLPGELRHGLIAVTTLSFISFVSTGVLVFYITYRLIKWERVARQIPQSHIEGQIGRSSDGTSSDDLSLGLEERHYVHLKTKSAPASEPPTPRLEKAPHPVEKEYTRWNPILMLIYNLLFANLFEAMAFLLSIEWLKEDGIFAPTAACWAQGWFMQVGKLVCSGMLVLISINTYTTVVRGYKLSRTAIYASTALVWVIAFALPFGSVLGTQNGADHGGFYARAGAWCWVNPQYGALGLWLEYFWIFVAMAVTVFLLLLVIISLYRNNQSVRHFPSTVSKSMEPREKNEPPKPSGHHPAFLVYQIIYIVCTAPLAISRMTAMSGVKAGWPFYGIAGSLIASHGWLNVLLWSTTIFFIGDQDIQETGLEKFAFIRTPQRIYGNMVMVQGGHELRSTPRRSWWPPCRALQRMSSNELPHDIRSRSEDSLRRSASLENSAIEVEIEAKIVIEDVNEEQLTPSSVGSFERDDRG